MTWAEGLSIYATIVSTTVGFVEVFRVVRETRSKLVVDLSIFDEQSIDDDDNVTSQTIIRVNIVNHSTSDRVITMQPWLNLDTSGSRFAPPTEVQDPFPKRLLPGDACEFLYNFRSIQAWAKNSAASKLRATVDDTYANHYRSKWVKIPDTYR